ncbi:MAG: hypothetical protein RSD23_10065, partial [Ruthenibacterium sp.]
RSHIRLIFIFGTELLKLINDKHGELQTIREKSRIWIYFCDNLYFIAINIVFFDDFLIFGYIF